MLTNIFAIAASTFITVFALGFQSRNVNQGQYGLAIVTSIAISTGSLFLYKAMPGAEILDCLAYYLSAILGIVASIYVHQRWFTKKKRVDEHADVARCGDIRCGYPGDRA